MDKAMPEDPLALYYYPSCPYCQRVLRCLDALNLEIDLRNIHARESDRQALLEARKRGTVPVLRIIEDDGQVTWMPESLDIVAYLNQRFGPARDLDEDPA